MTEIRNIAIIAHPGTTASTLATGQVWTTPVGKPSFLRGEKWFN